MSQADLCLVNTEKFKPYVDRFNRIYPEEIVNAIPDREAWEWMLVNIPFLYCPDRTIEEIYYFRWWTYRKNIRQTPDGFVVTEFLPDVDHAKKHNTINCPVGHHIYEGRWIKDARVLDEYIRFMLEGGDLHQYSCWFADAVYKRHWINPDEAYITNLLPPLQEYFQKWQLREKDGLFHYSPWMDGMEYSISGNLEERFRPTLNSYMYADALAISEVAKIVENRIVEENFSKNAASIKANVQAKLWNNDLKFFGTRDEEGNFTPIGNPVREAAGYVPWYFNLPDPGYESAWKHLNDLQGFFTPVGLTAAEVRHSQFLKVNPERLAAWDGAIWPYATSQTLTALQNLLRNYSQTFVSATDYMRELGKYAASHIRDGKPSISEVLRDPYVRQMSGSEHYNHSTFCDLVITGAAGLVPRPEDVLEVNPLFPADWDYFCLDGVRYRGHLVTIAWDRTGDRYGNRGLHIYVDKEKRYSSEDLGSMKLDLAS